jgi:CRISPR-associated protein Csm5
MTKAFMQTTRCAISTLSPVHIGCGEDYYPTNYVIDGGFLHHFSEEGLLAALTLPEKNALAKIAEKQNDRNDSGIKELQEFIYSKRDKLQIYATHAVPLSKELEKFYQSRIGKTAQREGNGRNVNNQLAIARHAFNPYNQTPYFAGSSIKGAIRTALLNSLNENESLQSRLNELKIKDEKNRPVVVSERHGIPKHTNKNPNNELQKLLLDYQEISDNVEKDIKGDPLRLLKIGDATYKNLDNLNADEIRFAVNRKIKIQKKQSELYQILECLPANRSRALTFDMTSLANQNSEYRWTVREISNACNEFFVPQLERELEMLNQRHYANADWVQGMEKLLANELSEAFKNQQAFLLRVGQHGGAESNTLDGVRHIHIPQHKKYLPKPTTIWLAGDNKDQQDNLLPFGWVLVEIGDFVFDKTHAFLKTQAAPDYERRLKQEKLVQQQAEATEQARLQEQAEQEKAAQLATMTTEQRLIFELKTAVEKDKNPDPNGTLRQSLSSAIKQAESWSPADKQALLEIGNGLCSFWGKPKKLKDQIKTLQAKP